jgi:hypothetical protein
MEIDHFFTGMVNDIFEDAMKDENIYVRDDDGDDFSYNGLEGSMGKGLGWLRGQGIVNKFNLHVGNALILMKNYQFRTSGCLLPRKIGAVIVLSENWMSNSTELNEILMNSSCNEEYNSLETTSNQVIITLHDNTSI